MSQESRSFEDLPKPLGLAEWSEKQKRERGETFKREKLPAIMQAVAARLEDYTTDPSVRGVEYDVSVAEAIRNGETIEYKHGLEGQVDEVCARFNLNLEQKDIVLETVFGKNYRQR